jgi:hypothetical protein
VSARLHCCVALPGAVVPEQDELSYCVCGTGNLKVFCDEQAVIREMAVGRGTG